MREGGGRKEEERGKGGEGREGKREKGEWEKWRNKLREREGKRRREMVQDNIMFHWLYPQGREERMPQKLAVALSYLQFLQFSVKILRGNGGWKQVGPGWLQSLDTVSERAQLV